MQQAQQRCGGRPLVIIDFELIFDVWSLLCCCVRASAGTQPQQLPFQSQQTYPTLFHKPIQQAVSEYSSADSSAILDSFRHLAPSVKPWIPAYQLMERLHKETQCTFTLRPTTEMDLIRLMPVVSQLQARLGGADSLKICTEEVSDDTLREAALVLTSDVQFYERAQQLASRADQASTVKLVRPRKLAAYEGVPDLIDLQQFTIGDQEVTFTPVPSNKFISLASLSSEISAVPESAYWSDHVAIEPPLELSGTVVKGFGRGSKQLGCPTANVEMTEQNRELTAGLVPGVYAAKARLQLEGSEEREYLCAMSIGWNPVYDNAEKTIEAFLIHDFAGTEFYGAQLALSVTSFIRAEALFGDFDSLIQAIQCDIQSVIGANSSYATTHHP